MLKSWLILYLRCYKKIFV